MLDTLAMIIADELLDLALVVLAFIERDADRLVRRNHRLAGKAGGLALDIEEFLFLEPEEGAVKFAPYPHLSAPDIMREMIEQVEADAVFRRLLLPAGKLGPVGIGIAVCRHEIEIGAADPFDDRVVLRRRLAAIGQRPFERGCGIGDAEGHGAGRRAMHAAKFSHATGIVAVEHQIDAPLAVTGDVLARVAMAGDEA